MYRIEVARGEETVFRTIEELAVGIRNGVVTPRARIYHNASQKWLPIGLHPHYKKAIELSAATGAPAPAPTAAPAATRTRPRHPTPTVPAPTVSPVVTMQQEVLRDLPVIAMPEPRQRSAPMAAPAPIARIAQPVQVQPTAEVTFARTVFTEPEIERRPARPAPEEHTRAQEHPQAHEHPRAREHPGPQEHSHAHEHPPERPTARRSPRPGGRPFLVLGAAAALALAAQFALTARSSAVARTSPTSAPMDESPAPAAESVSEEPVEPAPLTDAEAPDAEAADVGAPRVTSAPARVPMTPGPAFAGSVPARPGSDTVAVKAPSPRPAAPGSAQEVPAIAPAPAELDLALPLASDSLAPVTRDTMAMKKLLRALNGSSPEASPAP